MPAGRGFEERRYSRIRLLSNFTVLASQLCGELLASGFRYVVFVACGGCLGSPLPESPSSLIQRQEVLQLDGSAGQAGSVCEVRCSPTKPCGKGSKRKQDDMDEDDEPEQQSWVEALTQELTDEDHAGDPDYEPSAIETDSEEYRSHNETESDIEVEKGVVVIKDLETHILHPGPPQFHVERVTPDLTLCSLDYIKDHLEEGRDPQMQYSKGKLIYESV
ncbi:hypothetical protein NFI96_001444 [Prochilodus magdalenae]|nr:hypothetical protein NFI96_001444 [Prochilodus magdalenae]